MIERRRRERRRPTRRKFNLKKFFRDYPIVLVVAVVFSIGAVGGYAFGKTGFVWRSSNSDVLVREALKKMAQVAPPTPAIATPPPPLKRFVPKQTVPGEAFPIAKPVLPQPVVERFEKPQIIFVIDDIGHSKRYADLLFSINRPVTFAILPELAYSKYFAEEGKKRGFETILHLPLEPEGEEEDPGPGAITADMKSDEIKATLEKNLSTVPGVTGVNNHMGSRVTKDRHLMYLISKELKSKQLFFLDSLTHPNSVAHEVAFAVGVPTAERDIFLDNEDDSDYISERIEETAQIAKRTGKAIAIGHMREKTLLAIKKVIPNLEAQGFEFSSLKDVT